MKRVKHSELPPPDPRILHEMLAARQAPGTKGTERAFLQGRVGAGHDLDHMPINSRHKWLQLAAQQGVSLSGKVYQSGAGSHPWDLSAWVSSADEALDRVKRHGDRAMYRNGECVYMPPEKPPTPDIPLAEDIIQDSVREMVKVDPSLKKKKKQELREMVIEKHGPKKA